MDKAELIRHEIEKRRDHNLAIGNPLFAAMAEEDIELLLFIDSMQEEPAHRTKADVDAAMREVEEKAKLFTVAMNGKSSEQILAEMRGEEPVSEDLEKEINKEIINLHTAPCYDELEAFALHFIKWQKEKMMAKAVDGFVIEDIEEGNGDFLLSAEYIPKSMGLKDRQKVKVIVIKEE